MVNSVMIHMLKVDVVFDASDMTFSFGGDIDHKNGNLIEVKQGLSMISFALTTVNHTVGHEAGFQSEPIQWFDGERPISKPSSYLVQWHGLERCTLVCFNSVAEETSYKFNVVVAYDGETYGSDPTIVNMPPDGE